MTGAMAALPFCGLLWWAEPPRPQARLPGTDPQRGGGGAPVSSKKGPNAKDGARSPRTACRRPRCGKSRAVATMRGVSLDEAPKVGARRYLPASGPPAARRRRPCLPHERGPPTTSLDPVMTLHFCWARAAGLCAAGVRSYRLDARKNPLRADACDPLPCCRRTFAVGACGRRCAGGSRNLRRSSHHGTR